jgi:hypothetical protein
MNSHLIFDIVSAVVSLAWIFIGLLIRANLSDIKIAQMKMKAELIQGQTDLRENFSKKMSDTDQKLAVHIAEDEKQFEFLNRMVNEIRAWVTKLLDNQAHKGSRGS